MHSVPCVGYVVHEAPRPGKIDPKKYIPDLERTKTPMSILGHIQQGESVELSDGTVLHAPPRRPGRKVVILGDTRDPSSIVPLALDADLLVHEATNAHLPDVDRASSDDTFQSVQARTQSRGHSTPQMAGAFAKRIGAKQLILNHFSARYKGNDDVDEEAKTIMDAIGALAAKEYGGEVTCARDLMSVMVVKK
jgi:ribonuclease Z